MKTLLFLGAAFAATDAMKLMSWKTEFTKEQLNDLDTRGVFEEWHKTFARNYVSEAEEAHRYGIWLDNLWRISDSNSQNHPYKLKLNEFGDLTEEEFRIKVHGPTGSCLGQNDKVALKQQNEKNKQKMIKKPSVDLPASVNWTAQGVVTPVKNQGDCGSCWAFSTTGSLECDYAIKTGKLVSLSEQQLVDCSGSYGNKGCNGGWYYYGWNYANAEGGLCTESSYPYTGVQGSCQSTSCGEKYDTPSKPSYYSVPADNEADLQTASASGCVSVAIEANQFAFQYYSSGVLTGTCGTSIDHAVLVVGYGNLDGQDYWLVKNSWGSSWGLEGYVLICRNCNDNGAEGECGIDMYPAYPLF